MARSILTDDAERAHRAVNSSLALYRTMQDFGPASPRISGEHDINSEHLTLPVLVSLVEEYVREALVQATESRLSLQDPLEIRFWEQAEAGAESSWEKLKEAWSAWHEVNIADPGLYPQVMGLIEARNSIVHGLGQLTRKQTRQGRYRKTQSKLRQAGIILLDGRITITGANIEFAATTMKDYLSWLDVHLQTEGIRSHTSQSARQTIV